LGSEASRAGERRRLGSLRGEVLTK